jgi:hypothetical protein
MVPSLMVFMGNFSAAAGSGGGPSAAAAATAAVAGSAGGGCVDYLALREGFSTLARLIDTYPAIKVGQGGCKEGGSGSVLWSRSQHNT